ncbi:hypothetical protein ACFL29_02290 [Patescibacteria group bacterium]
MPIELKLKERVMYKYLLFIIIFAYGVSAEAKIKLGEKLPVDFNPPKKVQALNHQKLGSPYRIPFLYRAECQISFGFITVIGTYKKNYLLAYQHVGAVKLGNCINYTLFFMPKRKYNALKQRTKKIKKEQQIVKTILQKYLKTQPKKCLYPAEAE